MEDESTVVTQRALPLLPGETSLTMSQSDIQVEERSLVAIHHGRSAYVICAMSLEEDNHMRSDTVISRDYVYAGYYVKEK